MGTPTLHLLSFPPMQLPIRFRVEWCKESGRTTLGLKGPLLFVKMGR